MHQSVVTKTTHNLDNEIEDILREFKKGGERLGHNVDDALSQAIARLRCATHGLAAAARNESRALAKGAAKEIRNHPLATAAVAASAVALIGLAIARRGSAASRA
jgi:ElaB/YqjD/DUF883 family membrane-anchored ribosome-binding protein